jgi:rRNA small subunit pseudouridine methyltransferase Nep1
MLTLILGESALETVPEEIAHHPSVTRHAAKREKKPTETILDRSYHHSAMRTLENASKRGRPDIVHFTLLEALGSPLNMEGALRTYVHTLDDRVISVDPRTRLPRNYDRFVGLVEQLFQKGRIPPKGDTLLETKRQTLNELVNEIRSTRLVVLTTEGDPMTSDQLADILAREQRPTILIGGFPHGHFAEKTLHLTDEHVAIDPDPLEAWIVASRVLSSFERAKGLPKKRILRRKEI